MKCKLPSAPRITCFQFCLCSLHPSPLYLWTIYCLKMNWDLLLSGEKGCCVQDPLGRGELSTLSNPEALCFRTLKTL